MTRMMSMKADTEADKQDVADKQSFHEKQAQSQGKKTAKPTDKPDGKRPNK
jgi:hypothetical protein